MANEYAVNQADLVTVANAIRAKGETDAELVFPGDFVLAIEAIPGGGSANFEVVAQTDQPSSPTENMIWVETSTTMPSWSLSPTAPASPEGGDVWIATGASSAVPFNAVADGVNALMVYPIDVKQYLDGGWSAVTAKSYIGGAWVDWLTFLFNNGNKCESVVGEWQEYKVGSGVIEWGETSLHLYWSGGSSRISSVYTQNTFDVTGFSTLNVKVGSIATTSTSAGTPSLLFGLCSEPYNSTSHTAAKANFVAYTECKDNVASDTLYTLDLSSVSSGEYFVQLYQLSCDITIKEIYFS